MLRTRLCELLRIEVPILVAPMGFVTGPELTAAVSNAGGLGVLAAGLNPPPVLKQEIDQVRALTDKPFGVNLLLQFPQDENVELCLAERVPVLSFYWGDPTGYVERAHAAAALVVHQVGSVEAAQRSARAGVDVIIAQGFEAGGHVAGRIATLPFVPRVVDAVAPTPVVAAGGIADARGLVAALALGADGVSIGTRFLATPESLAHPYYKDKVLAATEEDTVHTILFGNTWPDSPHRVLRTAFVEQWLPEEARAQEGRPDEPLIGETKIGGQSVPLARFMGAPPSIHASGDLGSMALYAGQCAGLVQEIKPAAAVMQELVEGARAIIEQRLYGTLHSVPV